MRADATRGAITPEEATSITRTLQQILDDFDVAALPAAATRDSSAPPAPASTMRVLGCPARDEIDEAALRILASRLAVDGLDVDMAPSRLLAAEVVERASLLSPAVVVVGTMAPGGVAHARYLIKRLRARFPDLPVIAVRWGSLAGLEEARAQLTAAGANEVVSTVRETRDRILAFRQVRAAPSQAA
jgi:methylmalonyl-CoA mutase cobalamin-binding subunit